MRVIEDMYSNKRVEVADNAPVQRGEPGYMPDI